MLRWAVGHARTWDWNKIDEIVASFARPYQQYLCSTAVAFSAVWSVVVKADALVIGITVPAAAALAGTGAYLRSVDKKTEATKEISKNQLSPDTSVKAEIK